MNIGDWLRNLFNASEATPPPRLPPDAPARHDIEARLRASNVPGAALARIRDGEVAWVAGYGRTRAGRRGAHVTGDTIFQAASLSKPVTALAVMQLVEAGVLSLDTDVRTIARHPIPEHPILAHHPDQRRHPITVRLLLQHRSGIVGRGTTPAGRRDYLAENAGGGSLRYTRQRGVRVPTLAESWSGATGRLGVTVTYPPGSRVSYSGAGYLVLQHVIEQVTGRPFHQHMADVLHQFGARAATFEMDPPAHLPLARAATPWRAESSRAATNWCRGAPQAACSSPRPAWPRSSPPSSDATTPSSNGHPSTAWPPNGSGCRSGADPDEPSSCTVATTVATAPPSPGCSKTRLAPWS